VTAPPEISGALNALRQRGWSVAVHNDYRQNGEAKTFWLFTHVGTGYFVKGEGKDDTEALRDVFSAIDALMRTLEAEGAKHLAAQRLANRVLGELGLAQRWPCPTCERDGPNEPLRLLARQPCDRNRKPIGPLHYGGCERCNEHDRLITLATQYLGKEE
jgi:hypothetical protein